MSAELFADPSGQDAVAFARLSPREQQLFVSEQKKHSTRQERIALLRQDVNKFVSEQQRGGAKTLAQCTVRYIYGLGTRAVWFYRHTNFGRLYVATTGELLVDHTLDGYDLNPAGTQILDLAHLPNTQLIQIAPTEHERYLSRVNVSYGWAEAKRRKAEKKARKKLSMSLPPLERFRLKLWYIKEAFLGLGALPEYLRD